MKYENGKEILPAALLKEVQKYAGGKLLYIPVGNENKSWGEVSGYRQKLLKRNVLIANKYRAGATLSELAEEYFLSLDSIKKIVYGKKEKKLSFEPSVESAVHYANAGLLEEWLTLYFELFQHGYEFVAEEVVCCGVRKVPLRLVESVTAEESIFSEEPLILSFRDGKFLVDCQRELYAGLMQQKANAYPSLIMVRKEEYRQFERQFERYFVVVN